MRYRRPDDMLALCSVLALLLFVLQYFTISKFSVLDSAGYISLGHFLENVRDKIEFDPLDVVWVWARWGYSRHWWFCKCYADV
ncbi:MAG TPA: hypothetical protein EYQ18_24455 [Candidatus Handelsmanbacteria bacterium]|nr:hypothetical protein [Candidatus Handelsmanbacteria bacterium]